MKKYPRSGWPWLEFAGVQGFVTESDDGAVSRSWSRRTGSNPVMTSASMTIVGVSLLRYFSDIARRASRSVADIEFFEG